MREEIMKSKVAFDAQLDLTTPVELLDGTKGYVLGRYWNIRVERQEYDLHLNDNRDLRAITPDQFRVIGAPRPDVLRVA
jgi:hypothetical protein